MQRLLRDAEEFNGLEMGAYQIDNFADIVDAIHAVQENLGITGTTSKEAATTIEGSLNTVKGAWNNLVAGFANPDADMDQLMNNLVVAIVGENEGEGLLNNILPAVERALRGIGDFIVKAAPIIAQRLPALMNAILPSLIKAATALVAGLVKALPSILQVLIEQAPMIISMLAQALQETAPMLVELGKNLMTSIYNGLVNAFPQLQGALDMVAGIFSTVFDGITTAIDFVVEHIDTIAPIVAAVVGVITGLGILSIISGIVTAITGVATAIGGVISALGMIQSFAGLISVITTLAGGPLVLIVAAIGAVAGAFIYLWNTSEEFRNFWIGLWEGIKATASAAWEAIKSVVSTIAKVIPETWNNIKNAVTTTVENIKNGVRQKFVDMVREVLLRVGAIKEGIRDRFEQAKDNALQIVENIKNGVQQKFVGMVQEVLLRVGAIKEGIRDRFEQAKDTALQIFENIKNGIKDKIDAAKDIVSRIIDDIKGLFKFDWSLPELKLPHISISEYLDVPGLGTVPAPWGIHVDWYRKAYENPWMFTKPTTLGNVGFGDGPGGEIVYGHTNLMEDIRDAVKAGGGGTFAPVINVYTREGQSNEEIADYVIDKLTREYRRNR